MYVVPGRWEGAKKREKRKDNHVGNLLSVKQGGTKVLSLLNIFASNLVHTARPLACCIAGLFLPPLLPPFLPSFLPSFLGKARHRERYGQVFGRDTLRDNDLRQHIRPGGPA